MSEQRSRAEPFAGPTAPSWSAWRAVVGFGVVSLSADMVYEGARSITGPYLASLGASALVVGLVTGAGEATALLLRLVSGPLADRSRRYWTLTLVGYAMTAVCVPALAVAPFLGAAGLAVASALLLAERAGKAVRSPAKSALLAQAAAAVGRGRGFAVHKSLDQVGAFAGPLLVAAVLAVTTAQWPAFAVLAVPGAVAIVLLLLIRRRVPDPSVYEASALSSAARPDGSDTAVGEEAGRGGLPGEFYLFATGVAMCTAGLMTYGILSYHLVEADLVSSGWVPVLYAAAMLAGAAAALAVGEVYDRWGARVLFALPLLVAVVPWLAFSTGLVAVVVGILVWGAAVGVQDSAVKAWWPTWCRGPGWGRRTACSRPSRVPPPSSGAWPRVSCTRVGGPTWRSRCCSRRRWPRRC
jgi:MFS family permease